MYKKAIITSGPTIEWLDPVRFITNASSGKMGFCLAEEIQTWIPQTTYIYGNVRDKYQAAKNVHCRSIETTQELLIAIQEELQPDSLLIMAAAPLDFRPQQELSHKIKKQNRKSIDLKLIANPDILMEISQYLAKKQWNGVRKMGFAAETTDLAKNALAKLERKNLDWIAGNYVGKNLSGFGENPSQIEIYSARGMEQKLGPDTKQNLAKGISEFLKKQIL